MAPRSINRLTAVQVRAALRKPGRHGDGGGLFLEVGTGGAASWVLRLTVAGRRRDIGLGSALSVPLETARQRAQLLRQQVAAGLDPLAEKRRSAAIPTFEAAARTVHAEQMSGWKSGKHNAQWLSSLETYAFPTIGSTSVAEVGSGEVRDLLAPIWMSKAETARRVFQRVRTVLDWAASKGWRSELETRAVLRGLPKQRVRPEHFAAMPYDQVPAFMARLREREAVSRLALEFVILTACRSGEARGATWAEIDLEAKLWTIPAGRMKAGREHVVPLSSAAVRLLERMAALRSDRQDLLFPGMKAGRPLSDMTLTKLLRDLGVPVTAHGFRSSFRDWAAEQTSMSADVVEAALAHIISDKTIAAYKRTVFTEKRRQLMELWGRYADGQAADNVSPISNARSTRA